MEVDLLSESFRGFRNQVDAVALEHLLLKEEMKGDLFKARGQRIVHLGAGERIMTVSAAEKAHTEWERRLIEDPTLARAGWNRTGFAEQVRQQRTQSYTRKWWRAFWRRVVKRIPYGRKLFGSLYKNVETNAEKYEHFDEYLDAV